MSRCVAFVVFCLVLAISIHFLTFRLHSAPILVDFLPAETTALVEGRNCIQTWAWWQQSVVRSLLHNPDFSALLAQQGVADRFLDPVRKTAALLKDIDPIPPSLRQVLGHKGLLAILPQASSHLSEDIDLPARLVMILQLNGDTLSEQWLTDYLGPILSRTSGNYQGQTLITLQFANQKSIVYCLYHGVLLAALNREPIERCLNQYRQRMVQAQTGLQLNQPYQRLKQLADGHPDFFFYADLRALNSWGQFQLRDGQQGRLVLPQQVCLFQQSEANQQRLGFAALVDTGQPIPLTTLQPQFPPTPDPLVDQFSNDTFFALWTNWLHLAKLWQWGMHKGGPEITALMSLFAEHVETTTGKPMATFFDAIGTEFGVFIEQHRAPRQAPRTLACVSFEISDQQVVNTLLSQMIAGMQAVTVVTKGIEIVSVVLAGGLLQPAYAVLPHKLILADSIELIEHLHGQNGSGKTGGQQHAPMERDRGGNVFLFVRTGALAERLLPLVMTLRKENREMLDILSLKNRDLIQQVILPVLTGLRDVEYSRFRGFAFEGEMLLEMNYTLR